MLILLISIFLLGFVLDNIDSNILFRNLDKSYVEEKVALRSELTYILNNKSARDYFIAIVEERESGRIPNRIKTHRYTSVLNKKTVDLKVLDYRRNILKAQIKYMTSINKLIVTITPINPLVYRTKGKIVLEDLSDEDLSYLEAFLDELRQTGAIPIKNYYESMLESDREGLIYIDQNVDEPLMFKGIIVLDHDMINVENYWDKEFVSQLRDLTTFYVFNKMSYTLDLRL